MLCTDFWAGPIIRSVAAGPFQSLRTRFHPELADQSAHVRSWNLRALEWERLLRGKFSQKHQAESGMGLYHGFVEVGRRFANCVRDELVRTSDMKPGAILFAYDTGALEAFKWCQNHGIKCILNQMDPSRVEVDMVRMEEKSWPGWASQTLEVPEEYFSRREREWALADRIVINSEFSRGALLQQGVPAEKLVVIPLCYESVELEKNSNPKAWESGQPLRVLFLGQVILRKGIQYLLSAARELVHEQIHFDIVGPVGISSEAINSAPPNVAFHGRVSRDQAAFWYQRSHVFVLPTISDGFAITQIEAMAHGLPVIATSSCGEVVADGVDGFLIPPRDAGSLAQAFRRYLAQPELLPAHSTAARLKSRQFSLQKLGDNLMGLEAGLNRDGIV